MSRFSTGIPQESTIGQPQPEQKPADGPGPVLVPRSNDTSEDPIVSLRSVRSRVETEAIRSALERTGWNRKEAARLLKISYRGLLYKIRQHNITPRVEHG